jgi:hypothetical protein
MNKTKPKSRGPAKPARWGEAERQRCIADAKRELDFIGKEISGLDRLIAAAQDDRERIRFQRMMVRGVLQILTRP